jgi:uncharacterized protein (TIGR02246 family)
MLKTGDPELSWMTLVFTGDAPGGPVARPERMVLHMDIRPSARLRSGHLLIALAFVVGALAACGTPASRTEDEGAPGHEITALMSQQANAWARGDAKGYADTFTDSGALVVFSGDYLKGRPDIEAGMARYFSAYLRGSRLHYDRTLSTDHLDPSTTVVVTRGCVLHSRTENTCSPQNMSTTMNIFHREGAVWKYAAFENTRYQPLPG